MLPANYEMYTMTTKPRQLRPNDLVIRLQNTQHDPCTAATQLREIITFKDQKIDQLKEDRVLPLVAKCVQFYGTEVIVRQLKTRYLKNNTIQNFRGWSDCTTYAYQTKAGKWLQADIDQIINADPNITPAWDTLRFMCQQRNKILHGKITEDDLQLLNDTAQYFQNHPNTYPIEYGTAVQSLANALDNVDRGLFAASDQYALANLL